MKTNSIEPLEARIAPAAVFVNATTATFTDVDGDLVTVKFSKPGLTAANVTDVLETTPTGPLGGDQLTRIDLNNNANFAGTSITLTAKPQDVSTPADGVKDGDGLVNVGWINALGIDLDAVKIPGDLGKVLAGDATLTTAGLASLSVVSLGRFGHAPDDNTAIQGRLGALTVSGETVFGSEVKAGSIGAITVGGSLGSGVKSDGDIGMVKVGGDANGFISATGNLAGATIGGRAAGFGGAGVGMLKVGGTCGGIQCDTLAGLDAGSLVGNILASRGLGLIQVRGSAFGKISTNLGDIAGVRIGGDYGGNAISAQTGGIGFVQIGGDFAGVWISSGGDIGKIAIGGDLKGGSDEYGKIDCGGKLGSLTIGGSVVGDSGKFNTLTDTNGLLHEGQIFAVGAIGKVVIGGSVLGGLGNASGEIRSHTSIGSVVIGGSLLGFQSDTAGEGTASGQIASDGDIGSVKIGGDMLAGAGEYSGRIGAGGKLGSVSIGGDVAGQSGAPAANSAVITSAGDMGTVTIGGSLAGYQASSGTISSGGKLKSVVIAGLLIGGHYNGSGQIVSVGDLGSVKIGGNVRGGSISGSDPTLDRTGYIEGSRIGSVFIGGSIFTGTDSSTGGDLTRNASIRAVNDIGSVTVEGSLVGNGNANDVNSTPVIITARGQASLPASNDVAIGKITVGGRIELANILAGYDTAFGAVNADAQIGSVSVSGDWISSYLLAGVIDAGDGFGNSSDTKIADVYQTGFKDLADKGGKGAISKIASVIIKGNAIGHSGTTPDFYTFGIEAQQLGKIKVGNATVPLLAGAGNDVMSPGNVANKARPLGASLGPTIDDGFDFHAFEVAVAP